jgi:hypothetical protein
VVQLTRLAVSISPFITAYSTSFAKIKQVHLSNIAFSGKIEIMDQHIINIEL